MIEMDFLVRYRETCVLNMHKTKVRLLTAERGEIEE